MFILHSLSRPIFFALLGLATAIPLSSEVKGNTELLAAEPNPSDNVPNVELPSSPAASPSAVDGVHDEQTQQEPTSPKKSSVEFITVDDKKDTPSASNTHSDKAVSEDQREKIKEFMSHATASNAMSDSSPSTDGGFEAAGSNSDADAASDNTDGQNQEEEMESDNTPEVDTKADVASASMNSPPFPRISPEDLPALFKLLSEMPESNERFVPQALKIIPASQIFGAPTPIREESPFTENAVATIIHLLRTSLDQQAEIKHMLSQLANRQNTLRSSVARIERRMYLQDEQTVPIMRRDSNLPTIMEISSF